MCFSLTDSKPPISVFHRKKTVNVYTAPCRYRSLVPPFFFLFVYGCFVHRSPMLRDWTSIRNTLFGCVGLFFLIHSPHFHLPGCGRKTGQENMPLYVSQES